jgi:flagellar hook-associated protein 2
MSLLSSGVGLVSGLNYTALVAALTAPEQSQITTLQTQDQSFKTKATAVSALSAQLLALTNSATSLGTASNFNSLSVQNSDPGQLTASTTTGATARNYQFQSLRLAAAQQTISQGFANTNQQLVGAGTIIISPGGQLATPTPLNILNGGAGVQPGSIRITDRSGASASVDLSNAYTVDDVISAINNTSGISVQASIQGGHLVLTDTSGRSTSNLSVTDNTLGGHTAEDLGISGSVAASTLTGSTVYQATGAFTLASLNDGNQIRLASNNQADLQIQLTDPGATTLAVNLTGAVTLNDIVKDINNAANNSGKLTASIANGRIVLTDNTGGGGSQPLSVSDINGSSAARQLGLDAPASGNTLTGNALVAGIDSVLLRNLRGGQGISQLGQISVTDRSGASATINLSGAQSLSDIISAINSAANLHVKAAIDAAGTGINVQDTSGSTAGNLVIADVGGSTAATQLGIAVNAAQSSIDSGPLGLQTVNLATALATYGPNATAVPIGQFRITDSTGHQSVVNIDSTVKTIGDLQQTIAAATGSKVTLQLNTTGDGFQLVDQAGGTGQLSVAELGGSTATDLRIVGTGSTGTNGKSQINSRLGASITTIASDTLASLVSKINAANAGVTASIINDGSSFSPNRLLLTSTQTGAVGRFTINDGGLGLGFATQTAGQDALLKVGSSASASTFIRTSSTNQFNSVFTGLDVDLKAVGTSPAQVALVADTSKISGFLTTLVSSYNSAISQLGTDLNFNTATNKQGTLEGDGTILQLSTVLPGLITNSLSGSAGNSIQSLAALGVSVNQDGTLSLDSTVLSQQLSQNPTAVSNFFLDSVNGFAGKLKSALNSFTDAKNGELTQDANGLAASSTSIEQRVTTLQAQLLSRQEALFNKFINLEKLLSNLRSQQTALSSLLGTSTTSTSGTGTSSGSNSTGSSSTGGAASIAAGGTGSTSGSSTQG